jgi:hypothetical protein
MSKRLRKRVNDNSEIAHRDMELTNQINQVSESKDHELFVIDRIGSKSARKRIAQTNSTDNQTDGNIPLSKKRIYNKIAKKSQQHRISNRTYSVAITNELRDIWDTNAQDEKSTIEKNIDLKVRPSKKIITPLAGQSYNPSESDHQDVLAEACALEIRKIEKDIHNPTINSTIVEANNTNFSFAYDDTDDEDDEMIQTTDRTKSKETNKRTKIVTRAMKNRKRSRQEQSFLESKKEAAKKLLKDIDVLPKLLQDVENKEKEINNKQTLRSLKLQTDKQGTNLSYENADMIPLSDELNGSLRSIVPKGNQLKDRLLTMVENGDAASKNRRKAKAFEKPHSAPKLKWVAKYKLTK